MKKVLYALIAIAVAAGLFGLGWFLRGAKSSASLAATSPYPSQVGHTSLMDLSEWQEFHAAREAALQSNPDLAAEYKALIEEMQDQQNKLDEAMIKADPTVAPVIAKLVALRQRNGASGASLPIR